MFLILFLPTRLVCMLNLNPLFSIYFALFNHQHSLFSLFIVFSNFFEHSTSIQLAFQNSRGFFHLLFSLNFFFLFISLSTCIPSFFQLQFCSFSFFPLMTVYFFFFSSSIRIQLGFFSYMVSNFGWVSTKKKKKG